MGWDGWDGMDISQTTRNARAPGGAKNQLKKDSGIGIGIGPSSSWV